MFPSFCCERHTSVTGAARLPVPGALDSPKKISTPTRCRVLAVGLACLAFALPAHADEAPESPPAAVPQEQPAEQTAAADPDAVEPDRETVVVIGRRMDPALDYSVDPGRLSPATPDAAAFANLIPGAGVVYNGPIAGQVQYRGMFGPRMNVSVGGMRIDPGGPNWMDPPLQYAPRYLLQSIELTRGMAPVSAGSETLGGHARAELKTSEFADEGETRWGVETDLGGRSADASFGTGGIVSFATENHRAHVLGGYEFGNDYRSPEGRVRPTEFERASYGAGYGFRFGEHQFGIDYRHQDVNDAGTPALPMDIRFFDTELLNVTYDGSAGDFDMDANFGWADIEHRMDNHSLRVAPPPARQRSSKARGKNISYDMSVSYSAYGGRLQVGTDGFFSRHDQYVFSPINEGFFVRNFKDSERDRYGVFTEWAGSPYEDVGLEMGFRYTRVNMDSGSVDSTPSGLLPPAMRLRDSFNAADREQSDNHYDFVIKLDYEPIDGLRFDLAGGRKTRSAYYIERYAWLPIEVTAGLGDGNNYVGTIDLEPEVSYEIEAGVAWQWKGLYIAPRGYYRKVNDYIQGTPEFCPTPLPPGPAFDVCRVSGLNGDTSPLRYSNVDAELYGIDAEFAVDLPFDLVLDGTISYVRGKRRDINDDLFRITPLAGRTTLTYRRDTWSISIEGVYAGDQDHVSTTNGETRSSSYAILNLFGSWDFADGWRLSGGIDNVTDNLYRQHLSGINRVMGSATDVGQRLPGLGINVYGRLGYVF
jgi:iron complex outermembrane receptor protein